MSAPISVKEFWETCYMIESRNGTETKLIFKEKVINVGSKMGIKMQQEELLKKLIESGEVIL
jgi:hypothetical protein